jgi:hypothetical protein
MSGPGLKRFKTQVSDPKSYKNNNSNQDYILETKKSPKAEVAPATHQQKKKKEESVSSDQLSVVLSQENESQGQQSPVDL